MADTIYLDGLIKEILDHLYECDEAYIDTISHKVSGSEIGAGSIEAIDDVLLDPNTKGQRIVDLANELLTGTFSYEGDRVVSVERESSLKM